MRKVFVSAAKPYPCPFIESAMALKTSVDIRRDSPRTLTLTSAGEAREERREDKYTLLQKGFIATGFQAYARSCPSCHACVSMRVNTDKFYLSRDQRRALNINGNNTLQIFDLRESLPDFLEIYTLYKNYMKRRHNKIDVNSADTKSFTKRLSELTHFLAVRNSDGEIISGVFVDIHNQEMNLEYVIYNLDDTPRSSLGKFTWLLALKWAKEHDIKYVYVAEWIAGGKSMDYKRHFRGLEAYTDEGWTEFDPAVHTQGHNTQMAIAELRNEIYGA